MLVRRIPPATIRFPDGAVITLSRKIASTAADVAIADAARIAKTVGNSSDPMGDIEHIHQHLDTLDVLLKSLDATADQLDAAAAVLDAKPATETGPMLDTATLARAVADALVAAQPDADLSDLRIAANTLRSAAGELREDAAITRNKRAKVDAHCRSAVAEAMANDRADPLDLDRSYETDFTVPKMLNADAIRTAAREHLLELRNDANAKRAQRRTEKRRELSAKMQEMWR